ncbi:hypothetical protein QTH87_25240 [Variovorax sp. J22P168]|uniref:hypothetical protein n=1 Tax=Variovorax jilinensis TaxID=3053513 RepID=UPI00257682F9|nr:hypothetical protein [Variovorax sp. J22P168]MDM0015769.1 hypothetical protein [Variovorax sp. J22P168]
MFKNLRRGLVAINKHRDARVGADINLAHPFFSSEQRRAAHTIYESPNQVRFRMPNQPKAQVKPPAKKSTKTHSARDDFSAAVKKQLREQAGDRCSFPGCDKSTIGPSKEKSGAASARTGAAAHITAAAAGPGARRYDSTLSKGARGAFENGIWCCAAHAKLIDTDEETFSVPLLKHWRTVAIRRAELAQSRGIETSLKLAVGELGLAPDKVGFNKMPTSKKVHAVFLHSWIAAFMPLEAWQAARDFAYEHMLNAFEHGRATTTELEFSSHSVAIRDNGIAFDLESLKPKETLLGGGLFTYRGVAELIGCPPVLLQVANGQRECRLMLKLNREVALDQNPCSFDIPVPDWNVGAASRDIESQEFQRALASKSECETLFLVADTATMISHLGDLGPRIQDALATGKKVIVCFPETSQRVVDEYKARFPGIDAVVWNEGPGEVYF